MRLNKKIKVIDIRKNAPSLLEAIHSKDKNSFDHLWFGIKMYFSVPVKPKGKVVSVKLVSGFRLRGFKDELTGN